MRFGRTLFAVLVAMTTLLVGALATSATAQEAEQEPLQTVELPARVEAEAFDTGGEGIAYHEVDDDLAGNLRLDEGVDVYRKRVRGGYSELLGRTRNGEWVEYTVTAAEADEFEFKVILASGAADPGTVTVSVDGVDVGTVSGDTDAWYDWTARSAGLANLDAGDHVVRLTWADGAHVNVDAIEIVSTTPTCETGIQDAVDATLNGRFMEAERFSTPYAVVEEGTGGWWRGESNHYVEFCVGVETGGDYRIDARVFAPTRNDNSFYVSVDDGPLVEYVANRTGLFEWDAVNDAGILDPLPSKVAPLSQVIVDPLTWNLTPGDHTVRFYLRRDGAGLESIELVQPGEYPGVCGASEAECVALFALAPEFFPVDGFRDRDPCVRSAPGVSVTCENGAIVAIEVEDGTRFGAAEEVQLTSLAQEIGELTNLELLVLRDQNISVLPSEIGALTNLEVLEVTGAQLTELPPEIGNLTNLKALTLARNGTSNTNNGIALPSEFVNLTNLEMLDSSGSCLLIDDPAVRTFVDVVEPGWSDCNNPNPEPEPEPEPVLTEYPCDVFSAVNRRADVPGGLVVAPDNLVYFTDINNSLWVFTPRARSGADLGIIPASSVVAGDDRQVYFWYAGDEAADPLELSVLDREANTVTGLGIFEYDRRYGVTPVIADGVLYTFATGDGAPVPSLWAYDLVTGSTERVAAFDASFAVWIDGPVAGDDGKIYLTDRRGSEAEIWVYDPDTGSLNELGVDRFVDGMISDITVDGNGVVYFTADSADLQSELWVHEPVFGATRNLRVSLDIGGDFSDDVAARPLVAPDGRVWFFTDGPTGYESVWVYDPQTDSATDAGLTSEARAPSSLAIDPDGLAVYVVAYENFGFSDVIFGLPICDPQPLPDPLPGPLPPPPGPNPGPACETFARLNTGVDFPTSPTVGADGQIYFTDLSNSLWVHDPSTGVSTDLNVANASAPAIGADGSVYFWRLNEVQFGAIELTVLDQATGLTTGLGIFERDVVDSKPPVAVAADGVVYTFATGADGSAFALWSYDPATGVGTEIDTVAQAGAVWTDPVIAVNDLLYLVDDNGVEAELWVYDPALDSLSAVGVDAVVDGRIYDLTGAPDGTVYFTADTNDAASEMWVYRPNLNNISPIASVGLGSRGRVLEPTVGPDGLVWFLASADRLYVYDPITSVIDNTDFASVAEAPTELTVGPDGTAYVTAYDASARANDLWSYKVCP